MKRLLVRGRFELAVREAIEKTSEIKFKFNRGLFAGTAVFTIIIGLISYFFDYEEFPRTLSALVMFMIFVNVCIQFRPENENSGF